MLNLNQLDLKIVEKKKLFIGISLGIILVGLIVFLIFGFNVGIDFSGGTVISVQLGEYVNDDNYNEYKTAVTEILSEQGIEVDRVQRLTSSETPGISFRYQNVVDGKKVSEEVMNEVNSAVSDALDAKIRDGLMVKFDKDNRGEDYIAINYKVNVNSVGATSSSALLLNAFLSVLVAAVVILIYIAFRFTLSSGFAAVIALMHDVLIMLALMAIFRIEVNAPFIAALITIIGYSINATIVIFDRVRENEKKYVSKDATKDMIANTSIASTLLRSINTSITTLITLLILCIIGVPEIRQFCLPIIFGLLAGTYSSIFIAPSLWTIFSKISFKKVDKKYEVASEK